MTTTKTRMRRPATTLAVTLLVASASLATLATPASAATTLEVCPSGCAYATPAAALASAAAGDTILVRPGTYSVALSVSTSVTLCATTATATGCVPNPAEVVLLGSGPYPVLLYADDVTLAGFTIRNPGYAATDQTVGTSAPALVGVLADRARVIDNVLEDPAAPLAPGQTRRYTAAVSIGLGADDAVVARNTIRDMVGGVGPGAICPAAPCKVYGVLNWGTGSGMLVEDNEIHVVGTGAPASAIDFNGNAGVVIRDNVIRIPGAAPGSGPVVTAIETALPAYATQVIHNDVATGLLEAPLGSHGVHGVFTFSTFRGNTFQNLQHAIALGHASSAANLIEDNTFRNNEEALVSLAQGTLVRDNAFSTGRVGVVLDSAGTGGSSGVVLAGNTFRDLATPLSVTTAVTGMSVDARRNDWGVYDRALIEARNRDESGTNTIDVSCYIDADGMTEVCPDAAIAPVILNARWPREIRFDDATSSARPIVNRTWTLPDGTFAYGESVQLTRSPGSVTMALRVRDAEGFEDATSLVLPLPNNAPRMTTPSTINAVEGTTLAFSLPVTDAQGDQVLYSMSGAPPGATLDENTGAFSWDVPYNALPSYSVTFVASDGAAADTDRATILVANTPVPPEIDPIAHQSVLEGNALSVAVVARDPNGGIPTLTAAPIPLGATFTDHGDGNATFAWTPTPGQANDYAILVTATASNALTATAWLNVSVVRDPKVSLTRVSTDPIHTSPGRTVTLHARLANPGLGADGYIFTALHDPAWIATLPPITRVAAGGEAIVAATLTAPALGGGTEFALRACSLADPTVCQYAIFHVLTPLRVVLDLPGDYAVSRAVEGVAHVTFLDGTIVAGATVSIHQQSTNLPTFLQSTTIVRTDATGAAPFSLDDVTARVPGRHHVLATASKDNNPPGGLETTYFVRAG